MKKGQIYEGIIEKVNFPNSGIIQIEGEKPVVVKDGLEGQKVSFSIHKIRKGKAEGRILEVLEKSPVQLEQPFCQHFGECGGCTYQNISYKEQLKLKERQIKELLAGVLSVNKTAEDAGNAGEKNTADQRMNTVEQIWEGLQGSPRQFGYRNKMEFSFGDLHKDGPLSLGMHKKGSFYDIVPVENCQIVDEDFRAILSMTLEYFREKGISYYHKLRHEGYLRHLLVRKGFKTGELLVDLVTTTEIENEEELLRSFSSNLKKLKLSGKLAGILHTRNDSVADTVTDEGTEILFGQQFFNEELMSLKFKITPFSFFQTNSLGAELLYGSVRKYVGSLISNAKEAGNIPVGNYSCNSKPDKIVYDLYSGTGTIAQILAPAAKKVIGVEIVEEAVEAAKENAKRNGLTNCQFIAGDVLKVLDTIEEKPDLIVLDPPRDGIHPKALERIINYGVDRMVYISCKPTSLMRDLEVLQARGYEIERAVGVDMFPGTVHVECVCLMTKKDK